MFGGAYVVDDFALVLKALFLLAGYVVVLLSTNYIAEGDYWEGEYYQLLLCSVLGMMVMASARDLISIFVALELLSIPAYMLAAWRKRDLKSNEAGMKYYLMGVFASAVMLYGMSLIYGFTGSTMLADIGASSVAIGIEPKPIVTLAHRVRDRRLRASRSRPCRSTPGRPTPTRARRRRSPRSWRWRRRRPASSRCSSSSSSASIGRSDVWEPLFCMLAALSMTVGNLIALRQTNVVRMLAYSAIAQAGFMLAPLAVAGDSARCREDARSRSSSTW